MQLRTNRLIIVSSILLLTSLSNTTAIEAGQLPRTVVHKVQSVRNPSRSTSYRRDGRTVEFDAPGAAKVETAACAQDGCGTFGQDVNAAGTIVGFYTDKFLVPHGFTRRRDGRFFTFDAPGAGLGHGLDEGTVPYAIDAAGGIVGQYEDSKTIFHGFVREPNGSFTTVDVPGAGTTPNSGQGTFPDNLNSYGDTAGFYIDDNNVEHGFVRSRTGRISTFDPPGSVHTHVCYANCLSAAGVSGVYNTKDGVVHGFLRSPNGELTVFDAPGATTATVVYGMNAQGTLAGLTADSNFHLRGMLRYRNGSYRFGEVPGGGNGAFQGTSPFAVNAFDAVTGNFIDSNNVYHAFEFFRNGALKRFDAPDAATTPNNGTFVATNNARGEVVGSYDDEDGLYHGFLWTP